MENKNKNTSLRQLAKEKYQLIVAEIKNPTKKLVRNRKTSEFLGNLLRFCIIAGLSFVIIFPLFQQISLAIRHPDDIANPLIIWLPEQFSFLNFRISIALLSYSESLINNIFISSMVMVCQVICASLAGYAFARLKFKFSEVFFWCLMLTLIIPPQAIAVSRKIYFDNFDIFGIFKLITGSTMQIGGPGKWGVFVLLSITGQGIKTALFIYMFKQFFRGLPKELEESAQIDGAGVFRTFWSVMLPNARGVMITVALFSFVWQWNDVYYTSLLGVNSGDFKLLAMQLLNVAEWLPAELKRQGLDRLVGEDIRGNTMFVSLIANTSAFLMMLPLLIAYIFVQRLFVEGIERSGIVG